VYILQSDLLEIKGVKLRGGNYGGSAPPDLWISKIYGFQVFWAPIGVEPT